MAAFIDMSPELKRPANRSIHPLVLVVLFAAGTVVGYGFNMGVVPAALGLAAGLRLALHPSRTWRHVLVLFVTLSVGWSLAERWLGAYSVLAQVGLGVYTAFWPTMLIVLTGRGPGALWRFVIFGAALDAIRGIWVFGGYGFDPWSRLLLVNDGLAQWLSVFGPWWCSGLVLLLFTLPWRWSLSGLLTVLLFGKMIRPSEGDPHLDIRLVQTNLPQDLRVGWATERWVPDITEFLSLSASNQSADLVVWPETMVPGFGFESASDVLEHLRKPWAEPVRMVKAWSQKTGTPMLIGTNIRDGLSIGASGLTWDRQVNASVLIQSDGTIERSEKIGLTPFGEYIPFVSTVPSLRDLLLKFVPEGSPIGAGLARGPAPVRFELKDVRLSAPICYESTLPSLVRSFVFEKGQRMADLLVVSSNDGWFGTVDTARSRFRDMCRMRAIETQTPVVRVANTGWTGLINSAGDLCSSLPVRVPGGLNVTVPIGTGVPWAVRGAMIWDWGLAFTVVLLCVCNIRQRRFSAGWDMLRP